MQKKLNLNIHIHTLALAFLFSLVVSGCATPPTQDVSLHSAHHQSMLAEKNNWLIKGKIGFKSPEKKQSANMRWQQKPAEYQLNLTSIIGTSILKMTGDTQHVSLEVDDKTYQDTDPSRLIWRITGWQIPIKDLQYWIKGQHKPNDWVTISEQGWVTQLTPVCDYCENLVIDYANYQLVDQLWLPHKITLNNQSNNSQLLIKVNTWTLN